MLSVGASTIDVTGLMEYGLVPIDYVTECNHKDFAGLYFQFEGKTITLFSQKVCMNTVWVLWSLKNRSSFAFTPYHRFGLGNSKRIWH